MLCTEQMATQSDISRNTHTRCVKEMSSFLAGGPCKLSWAWRLQIRPQIKQNSSAAWIAVARNTASGRVEWHAQVTTCTKTTSHDGSTRHRSDSNGKVRLQEFCLKHKILFHPRWASILRYWTSCVKPRFARPSDVTLRQWQSQQFTLLQNAPTITFRWPIELHTSGSFVVGTRCYIKAL
jgi:hypothetical protein